MMQKGYAVSEMHWLGCKLWGHRRRGVYSSPFFIYRRMFILKELSIFIDESGDFGDAVNQSPFYIVTLVFHNQADDITNNITRLKSWLAECDIQDEYVHTHPIIRKESPYNNLNIDERRRILNKMLRFTISCPIRYFNIIVNKRECKDRHALSASISKQLSRFIEDNQEYFFSFDRIVVYYDNGQNELSYILNVIMHAKLTAIEFKNASPKQYQLLQSADFICSIELLKQKRECNLLTKSETNFFYKPQELYKNYIKSVEKKKFIKNK